MTRLSTSDIDAGLRALGNVHLDGEGDPWLEIGPDEFRYVILSRSGAFMRLGENVLTRDQVETGCGRLVPMTD